LKEMLNTRGLDVPIGVDGGIDLENVRDIVEAGTTVLVAGSSVYNTRGSVKENVSGLLARVA
jgi:ribulose-phosphate 3-epimerase